MFFPQYTGKPYLIDQSHLSLSASALLLSSSFKSNTLLQSTAFFDTFLDIIQVLFVSILLRLAQLELAILVW